LSTIRACTVLSVAFWSFFAIGCSSAAEPDDVSSASPAPGAGAGAAARGGPPAQEEVGSSEADPEAPPPKPFVPKGTFVDPASVNPAVIARYAYVDPSHVLPKTLAEHAIMFFDANRRLIDNTRFMAIVDFSLHSGEKRFFVVDMNSGDVEARVVAHGKNSDPNFTGYATHFSNEEGSNMSSLGFAITGETYDGIHGRSLRLNGLSPTNSNMLDRAIVIHGASYVVEGQAKQGRSLGCFALDETEKDDVIDELEGGSLLYADLSE
jgi:hypothetical protein